MGTNIKIDILFLVAAVLSAVGQSLSFEHDDKASNQGSSSPITSMPRLFSFEYYKDVFKKTYASIGEELVRRKLVLARAFRAFISGVAYKYRQSKFYLALNKRSDRTPAELVELDSHVPPVPSMNPPRVVHKKEDLQLEKPLLVDEKEIESELEAISRMSGHASNSAYATIAKELPNLDSEKVPREKRDIEEPAVRDGFSFDALIKKPKSRRDKLKKRRRGGGYIPSNNLYYEAPELLSYGSNLPGDNPMPVKVVDELLKKSKSANSVQVQDETSVDNRNWMANVVGSFLSGVTASFRSNRRIPTKDVILMDHRDCMTDVKDQGSCGSCYAFVTTAYYEWLLCKQTGELITLSEQYMVDCGPEGNLQVGLYGCQGGKIPYAGFFFENYGAELSINYPYVGAKGSCPYDDFMGSKLKAGFFRFSQGSGSSTEIPIEMFGTRLESAPVIVSVGTGGSFHEYGGGIHNDKRCCRKTGDECGSHAVLIVGQGVADGEEYWLIRNSFSTAYGEDGYYKMSKQADCIWPKIGYVFAFEEDGQTIPLNAKRNGNRPDIRVRIKDRSRYPPILLRWLLK